MSIHDHGTPTESYGVMTPDGAELLAMGGTGAIFTHLDSPHEAIKLPYCTQSSTDNIEIEKRIYRRLGAHPNIIGCLRIDEKAIYLERAKYGSIRQYYREGGTATLRERITWSQDLAKVLHYIHEKGVRHVDIGGRNILLDANRDIRVCDFAGSAIDDVRPTVVAEDGFQHPDVSKNATIQAEIHALGSAIFELMTFTLPHWREEGKVEGMAATLLREGKYPDVTDVVLGNVITKCWKGEFTSAHEVADSINSKVRAIGVSAISLISNQCSNHR